MKILVCDGMLSFIWQLHHISWSWAVSVGERAGSAWKRHPPHSPMHWPDPCCMVSINSQALSRFSRVWLCDPMAYSPPGSPVCGVLRARILEWVAMPCSRGSSPPGDPTHGALTALAGRFVTTSASWEVVSVNSKGDWQINVRTTSGLLHALFFKD